MRVCGMHSMPSTHPMRTFTSLIASLILSCVNMAELLHDSATASFAWTYTVSMRSSWKLRTNKRVATRELATRLPMLSSSANCPVGQVATLSRSPIRSLRWCLWHKRNWLSESCSCPAGAQWKQRRRSTPSCCRPQTKMCSQGRSGPGTSTPSCKQAVAYRTAASNSRSNENMPLSRSERVSGVDCIQDMIKDRSGCCFPAALHAAMISWRWRIGRQASVTHLRMWVCFETVRSFFWLLNNRVHICKAYLPRRGGCSRASIAPVKPCPHRF